MSLEERRTDDLVSRVKKLTQDLEDLKNEFRARYSGAVSDGTVTIRDDNGDIRVQIGKLIAAGGSGDAFGLEVIDQPGTADWPDGFPFFRTTEAGAEFPYAQSGFVTATNAPVNITSGTFTDTWLTGINLIEHVYVACWVPVAVDVGTTGEIRIANLTNSTQSPALGLASGTVAYVEIPAWAHGTPVWTGPVEFSIQARRTSGAGNVGVNNSVLGLSYLPR